MAAFFSGLTLSFSLIVAIGSQNAYVLKQGLKREHVFFICLICALSDAILISLGVLGFSVVTSTVPWVEPLARYGGAVFLFVYGAMSFLSALKDASLLPSDQKSTSLFKSVLICLAFTWLNPHVYLDTVVLIGSISSTFSGKKVEFTTGAIIASFIFFYSLGYGAKFLRPVFNNPKSWKVLDIAIGFVMWAIAFSLIKPLVFGE